MITHDNVGSDQYSSFREDHLGEVLVHAVSAGCHPAPDISHPGHLQQALNGAVFTEWSVQYWKYHLDCIDITLGIDDAGALGHLFDRHQRTISHFDSRKLSGTGKSEDFVGPISHPDPLGANTDTGDIESFGVNRSYHVRRRKAGDRMLRTHPPEDDSDVDAIHVRSFPYDGTQPYRASTSVRVDDWPRGSNGLGNTCPFAHVVAIRRWELPPSPSNLGVNGVHDPIRGLPDRRKVVTTSQV